MNTRVTGADIAQPPAPGRLRSVAGARAGRLGLVALIGGSGLLASACGGPGTPSASSLLSTAVSEINAHQYSAAKTELDDLLKQRPSSYIAYYDLGVIDLQLGDTAGAMKEFAQSLSIDGNYVPSLYNEAVVDGATDPTLAMSLYRQVVRIQPHSPTAYLNLGMLEVRSGMKTQGEHDLNTAIRQDPALVPVVRARLNALSGKKSSKKSSSSGSSSTTTSTTAAAG